MPIVCSLHSYALYNITIYSSKTFITISSSNLIQSHAVCDNNCSVRSSELVV